MGSCRIRPWGTTMAGWLLVALIAAAPAQNVAQPLLTNATAPIVLYTDLASGPNSGGENNKGAYLAVFGKNFGAPAAADAAGRTVKVFINNVEVDNYRYLGPSKGRDDIQQITVQIGALGSPAAGIPLPIKVTVDGVASNTNVNFIVNPGRILFVDNVNGSDLRAAIGDIKKPFRHVQQANLAGGAWGSAQPGDIIVMRGTGKPWTDSSYENYFLRFRDKSGSAPTGAAGTGPITVMGYPGEDVYIATSKAAGFNGAISAINGSNYGGMGQWGTIADLRVEGGGDDGAINFEIYGHHWRVVNNELTAATARPSARAGGIAGNGRGVIIYGNHIHDVHGDGQTNHGIYIDNDGSYEIAYNLINDISGGNGVQMYTYGFTPEPQYTQNVVLHHNTIHDVNKHGINVADGTSNGIVIYDNLIYNTKVAGIRFNTNTLHGCRIYHNTIYNTDMQGNSSYGALMNDWNLPADALDVQNNIFVPHAGNPYGADSIGNGGVISHNLWFDGSGSYSADRAPRTGDPQFVQAGSDFHLKPGSAAISAGSPEVTLHTDYDLQLRTVPDIGAFAH
jgi:hypothetical protein